MLRCILGPNLVILAWTADELWGGQAQKEVKFDFQVKFDIEGQNRSSPKTKGTLAKVFFTFVPNLMILAWMSGELLCGQARDWYRHIRTHGHTDTKTDNTRRPKLASGKNYFEMSHRAWLLYCHALCKISKRFINENGCHGIKSFCGISFQDGFRTHNNLYSYQVPALEVLSLTVHNVAFWQIPWPYITS